MSSTTVTTPFPLGAYTGDPNNSDSSAEASYESLTQSFSDLMGVIPQFTDYYVDYNQTIPNWVSNAGWEASSAQQSPIASKMTPVIGLSFSSTGDTSISQDQYYKNFASGEYDSMIQGIVQQWASHGFTTQYWRPGWEFNLTWSPSYAGGDAQTQADWVAAFQHVSTVLHQAGQADGVNVQVIWNTSPTNYSNVAATTNLYPGNSYVDLIGADVYADMYPYSDTSGTPTYRDWDTGGEDTSIAQFIADPVNRAHYWTYPAATKWSNDSSGGHNLSLQNLLDFAKAQGKPFAIPETGAGNSNSGHDVADDSNFPQWLAQTLTASGDQIDFVNIWDSNGGGDHEFSQASDGRPGEAAAWAHYFGAQTAASATTTSTTPAQPVATTPAPATDSNTIVVGLAEDAYQGDAIANIAVDGNTIGTPTVSVLQSSGQYEAYSYTEQLTPGDHTLTVTFTNDAYGGTPQTDRNLYVDHVDINGASYPSGLSAALYSTGDTWTIPLHTT